jgi:hypothetical protein
MPGYAVAALVVLLAAGGLVARLGSPFFVTGGASVVEESWDLVADGVTWSRLSRLDQAIQAWRATYGSLPQTLQKLVEAGLVDRTYLYDAARRPIHYETSSDGYLLSAVDDGGRSRPDALLDRRKGI